METTNPKINDAERELLEMIGERNRIHTYLRTDGDIDEILCKIEDIQMGLKAEESYHQQMHGKLGGDDIDDDFAEVERLQSQASQAKASEDNYLWIQDMLDDVKETVGAPNWDGVKAFAHCLSERLKEAQAKSMEDHESYMHLVHIKATTEKDLQDAQNTNTELSQKASSWEQKYRYEQQKRIAQVDVLTKLIKSLIKR